MKEFIEKLIGRLEEESRFAVSLLGGKTSSYIAGCCDTNKKTISIVNQLAEEYKNESCKGDLISKSAFLKVLNDYLSRAYDCGGIDAENVIEYQQTHDDKSEYIVQGFYEVYELLGDIPTAYNNGWIPCSERLPEDKQRCITTAEIDFIPDHVDEPNSYIGVELNTYSKRYGWLHNQNVIAWQPLPPAFKPKGE